MQLNAIIVAGGLGTRMNNNMPKQLMLINGKTILQHSVEAFINTGLSFNFTIVCHANFIDAMQAALANLKIDNINFVTGGQSRYQSVQNGLNAIIDKKESIILVHDAVRCLIKPQLIINLIALCRTAGNAIPTINVKDSMRILKANNTNAAIDRSILQIVQTPQAFLSSIILPVFKQNDNPLFTDEATVCELSGHAIHLVPGDETNIKITYPSDIIFAQQILNK
jgi:2-C-methyl-D-erythritol 4-phosphate cytidylyltransferase